MIGLLGHDIELGWRTTPGRCLGYTLCVEHSQYQSMNAQPEDIAECKVFQSAPVSCHFIEHRSSICNAREISLTIDVC